MDAVGYALAAAAVYSDRAQALKDEGSAAPTPNYYCAVTTRDNRYLHVIAGASNNTVHQQFDWSSQTWTTKAAKPLGTHLCDAATLGGNVYVAGGSGTEQSSTTKRHEMWDAGSNTWTTKADLRGGYLEAGLYGHSYHGNPEGTYGYVRGGRGSNFIPYSHKRYDPATNGWSTLSTSGANAQYYHAVAPTDAGYYQIGGYDNNGTSNTATTLVLFFDYAANTWTTKAALPVARYHNSGFTDRDGLVYTVYGTPASSLLRYDPAANTWGGEDTTALSRYGAGPKTFPLGASKTEHIVALPSGSNAGSERFYPAGSFTTTKGLALLGWLAAN